MSYNVKDKELENVIALPPDTRYQYFIGKTTDWQELWSIGDDNGWALMGDESGSVLVPVWPAERYAKICCVGEWGNRHPKKIDLSDWLSKWIPGMAADGRLVAIFPLPNGKGPVVSPDRLKNDLEAGLAAYG